MNSILLNTVTRQSGQLTQNNRNFMLPDAQMGSLLSPTVSIRNYAVYDDCTGQRHAQPSSNPVSRDYLDNVWPSVTGAAPPTQYAMITDQTIVVGPVAGSGLYS